MKYYSLGLLKDNDLTESKKAYILWSNKLIGNGMYQKYLKYGFIPVSQCKTVDDEIFVPAWLLSSKSAWDYISKNRMIEFDKQGIEINRTFKTKEELKDNLIFSGSTVTIKTNELVKFISENAVKLSKFKYDSIQKGDNIIITIH